MKKIPPFVKNKKLYLEGRQKQKGGWVLRPALEIGVQLIKKLLGGKRKLKRTRVRRRKNW